MYVVVCQIILSELLQHILNHIYIKGEPRRLILCNQNVSEIIPMQTKKLHEVKALAYERLENQGFVDQSFHQSFPDMPL